MAMESVLKELETRIGELVDAYREADERARELAGRIDDLEHEAADLKRQLETSTDASGRVTELETQRDELATRLEKVVGLIDGVLDRGETD